MCGPTGESKRAAASLPRKKQPVPPTGSIFVNHTTARPGVCNVGGSTDPASFLEHHRGTHATFGRPRGGYATTSNGFQLSASGPSGGRDLPPIRKHDYPGPRKAPVVPRHEAPILGLRSGVDFIASNRKAAVESAPPRQSPPPDPLKKPAYGRVPPYLLKVKSQLIAETAYFEQLQRENKAKDSPQELQGPELEELRRQLVSKYNEVNAEYQRITHITKIDTLGLKRKKELCEILLCQLEKDLELLSRNQVLVTNN